MSAKPTGSGYTVRRGMGRKRLRDGLATPLLVVLGMSAGSQASALERVGGVELETGEDFPRSAVIDPAGQFAYFGTATAPGRVVKIDLATFTRVDGFDLDAGEDNLLSAVIDPAGEFAYFGTSTTPGGQVIKIDLATFTPVGTLSLLPEDCVLDLPGENCFLAAVIDPAGQFAYFGTYTIPSRVIKIDLETFSRVGAIELLDEPLLVSAVTDPAGQFAYFGTDTFPGQVVKIDLATFSRVGALELAAGEDQFRSAAIDPAGEFAYFNTWTSPGRVVKVDLTTFTRVGALELATGEDLIRAAVVHPAGELGYFGTFTSPGRVVEVDLQAFVRLQAIELAPGEDSLYPTVIDAAGQHAYFGTLTAPGRVVKVAVGPPPAPILAFVPATLDFGDVEVGTTGPPLSATLVNTGDADATGLDFGLTGDSGFSVDTGACGDTLPAGGECEVVVTFGPDLVGEFSSALEVTSAEGAAASLGLSGTGLGEMLAPVGLTVDATPLLSDGNQVFEPGECVEVAPAWLWLGTFDLFFGGEASAFEGPEGPSYDLIIDEVFYGEVEPGEIADCRDTDTCYAVQVGPSGVARPATHWDATLDEELFTKGDLPSWTWTLHVGESFADVPRSSPFYRSIETLLHGGVTSGCTSTGYCPAGAISRAQMPVFVLRALQGPGYVPPACVEDEEVFDDVPATSPFCPWIEELERRQVVAGCGGGNYCPGDPVTRAQTSILLLKTLEGPAYAPPPCSGVFDDVPCSSTFAAWIEELFNREIASGCSGEPPAYCPGAPVNRAQMAVFVTRTFGLALYGP